MSGRRETATARPAGARFHQRPRGMTVPRGRCRM